MDRQVEDGAMVPEFVEEWGSGGHKHFSPGFKALFGPNHLPHELDSLKEPKAACFYMRYTFLHWFSDVLGGNL